MMCFRYRKLIIPYSEGALDERTRAGIERHLESCEACRRELAAVQSVSSALRGMDEPAVEPASDLWARVSARIADEAPAPAPRPWLRVTQTASAFAAVALVAVVVFGVFHRAPNNNVGSEQKQIAQLMERHEPVNPAPRATVPEQATEVEKSIVVPVPKSPSAVIVAENRDGTSKKPKQSVRPKATQDKDKGTLIASAEIADEPYYSYKSEKSEGTRAAGLKRVEIASLAEPESITDYQARPAPAVGGSVDLADNNYDIAAGTGMAAQASVSKSVAMSFYVQQPNIVKGSAAPVVCAAAPAGLVAGEEETAVDALNRTEGVRTAAMFQYP